MNIENLQYFVSLAETLNFTKAAQKCHIAQTAMSRYIAQLEQGLGVELFERDKRNVTITKAGQQFYEDVVKLQEQYRQMLHNVRTVGESREYHVRIGFGLYEFSSLSGALSDLTVNHPSIQLEIHQYSYGLLVEKFKKKELDMIVALDVCREFLGTDEVEALHLFSSRNLLVMNREKGAMYEGHSVKEILEREIIITNCEDKGPSSIQMMQRTLEKDFGTKAPKLSQTNSFEAQLLMAQAGQGVVFIPQFMSDQIGESLVKRQLPESTVFDYYAITPKDKSSHVVPFIQQALLKKHDNFVMS